MHSKSILSTAALSSVAFALLDLPIPSEDAQDLESLVQGAIPTEYKSLIPSVCLCRDLERLLYKDRELTSDRRQRSSMISPHT